MRETNELLGSRVEQLSHHTRVTLPIEYTDGVTVHVGWDETYWCAKVEGIAHSAIGTHDDDQQGALLDLVCAMACTMNALDAVYVEDMTKVNALREELEAEVKALKADNVALRALQAETSPVMAALRAAFNDSVYRDGPTLAKHVEDMAQVYALQTSDVLQIVCRAWDDWEPRWESWLAFRAEHGASFLHDYRAFGAWMRTQLNTAQEGA